MNHYQGSVGINAPSEVVFKALTTQEGITGWWGEDCDVEYGVGKTVTARFTTTHVTESTLYHVLEIEKLVPNREVVWKCIDKPDPTRPNAEQSDEWIGTRVVFKMTPKEDGTTLLTVEHIGLVPALHCYSICTAGWDHLLHESIKPYVETGKGQPFTSEAKPDVVERVTRHLNP